MATRLQFPRGGAFSFARQFSPGGVALDLTSSTLVAYLKAHRDDADGDALASLSISTLVAAAGTVTVAVTAAQTASLWRGQEYFWQARATVSGSVYAPESCQGAVVLTPLDPVLALHLSEADEVLVPAAADAPVLTATVMPFPAIVGLTGGGSTKLDGIATTALAAGTTVLLSYGRLPQTWQLFAGTDAEAPTATPAIVRPDDYHASTNAKVWVQLM